ncbi:MAG TPA: hypothetical protein PKV92_07710 [Thermodesulfovibrio thiophilus]|nr:hypothetical protein [Thermodesulfovibrio thiophilus]
MKKSKVETKPEAPTKMGFINFLLVSGLLAWIITLTCNLLIFAVTLFYSEKSLLYALIFFAISIVGQILFLKSR